MILSVKPRCVRGIGFHQPLFCFQLCETMGKSRSIPIYKGYESIPINTISRGMDIHLPAMFGVHQGFLGSFDQQPPEKIEMCLTKVVVR